MQHDDEKAPGDDIPVALPARKPWAPPRLVPLDVSATEQDDFTIIS